MLAERGTLAGGRGRSPLRRLVVASAGFLAAFVILEVGVRIFATFDQNHLDEIVQRPAQASRGDFDLGEIIRPHPNDRIVYELKPGLKGRFHGQPLSINSFGVRGPERALEKSPGTFRIVGLGDSSMFGWAVAEEDNYLSILERTLNERFPDRRFDVWNLAVPGYNSVQEVETFAEKADRVAPDLVVIGWVGNDMDLPNFLAERPNPWSARKSLLLELIAQRWLLLPGLPYPSLGLFEVPQDSKTRRFLLQRDEIPERYWPLAGWENMVEAYRRLARMAKQRDIPAVVLFEAGPRSLKKLCATEGFVVAESEHVVVPYRKERGLDRTSLWVSPSDPHPSALKHELIAEALLRALLRTGALTPRAH